MHQAGHACNSLKKSENSGLAYIILKIVSKFQDKSKSFKQNHFYPLYAKKLEAKEMECIL